MCRRTPETPKTPAAANGSARKTKRTRNKSGSSKSGLSVAGELASLNASISVARGLLATLSLGHKSDWTRKLKRTEPEHLRILLQDVMAEIWNAQEVLDRLTTYPHPRLTV